jgi:hypothetical protein
VAPVWHVRGAFGRLNFEVSERHVEIKTCAESSGTDREPGCAVGSIAGRQSGTGSQELRTDFRNKVADDLSGIRTERNSGKALIALLLRARANARFKPAVNGYPKVERKNLLHGQQLALCDVIGCC